MLTFNELLKEALGSGLQPWEFYEYTIDEYMLRREGLHEKRKQRLREDFIHTQYICYYAISGRLPFSLKNKTIDEVIRNPYSDEPKEKPSRRETYKKLIETYKAQGLLN